MVDLRRLVRRSRWPSLLIAFLLASSAALASPPAASPPPAVAPASPPPAADPAAPARILRPRWNGATARVAVYQDAKGQRGFLTVGQGEERWTSPIYPLWKAMVADLDGDGHDELLLGIWSRIRRHDEPEPHRAIWVLAWEGRGLRPLWRGSALARPLVDATAADLDGDGVAELLALERQGDACWLTAYGWTGFGFAGRARRPADCAWTLAERPGCVRDPTSARARTRCARLVDGRITLP